MSEVIGERIATISGPNKAMAGSSDLVTISNTPWGGPAEIDEFVGELHAIHEETHFTGDTVLSKDKLTIGENSLTAKAVAKWLRMENDVLTVLCS